MSDPRVRKALETTLAAWAAQQSPAVPVVWENTTAEPDGVHVRSTLMPAPTRSLTLDRKHRLYTGIYQVSVYTPAGVGPGMAEALAHSLDGVFNVSTPLSMDGAVIQILQPPAAEDAMPEPGWWHVPVSIEYRCDVTRP